MSITEQVRDMAATKETNYSLNKQQWDRKNKSDNAKAKFEIMYENYIREKEKKKTPLK